VSYLLRIVPAAVFAAGVAGFASAETLKIAPEQPLQAMLDQARDGDLIELVPGEYKGASCWPGGRVRCSSAAAPATLSR
jgi:nitrous oxidase accessory protein